MKWLLLLTTIGMSDVEAPDPGPYDSLEICQAAGREWAMEQPTIKTGQGRILMCRPEE